MSLNWFLSTELLRKWTVARQGTGWGNANPITQLAALGEMLGGKSLALDTPQRTVAAQTWPAHCYRNAASSECSDVCRTLAGSIRQRAKALMRPRCQNRSD
jgi:hypothetical protein